MEHQNLVALYTFSEKKGAYIEDLSGNGNDLLIPEHFITPRHEFLLSRYARYALDSSFIRDLIINLVGFIPLGFLLAALLLRIRPLTGKFGTGLIVVLAGFTTSLLVEYLQIFIVQRSSSIVDLLVNTAGTAVGVALFFAFKPFTHSPQIPVV